MAQQGVLASKWADPAWYPRPVKAPSWNSGQQTASNKPKKKPSTPGRARHDARRKKDVRLNPDTHRFQIQYGNDTQWWTGPQHGDKFVLSTWDNPFDEPPPPDRFWRLQFVFSARTSGVQIVEKLMDPKSAGETFSAWYLDSCPDDFNHSSFYDYELIGPSGEAIPSVAIEFSLNKAIHHRFEWKSKYNGHGIPMYMSIEKLKSWAIEKSEPQPNRYRLIVEKKDFDVERALKCLQKEFMETLDFSPMDVDSVRITPTLPPPYPRIALANPGAQSAALLALSTSAGPLVWPAKPTLGTQHVVSPTADQAQIPRSSTVPITPEPFDTHEPEDFEADRKRMDELRPLILAAREDVAVLKRKAAEAEERLAQLNEEYKELAVRTL